MHPHYIQTQCKIEVHTKELVLYLTYTLCIERSGKAIILFNPFYSIGYFRSWHHFLFLDNIEKFKKNLS